jgi:hypothetical protein
VLAGVKSLATEIQTTIDRIHSPASSEEELLQLLADERALVRANVLLELGKRGATNEQRVVQAVVSAAHASAQADVKLMGTVNQRVLAVAVLAWLGTEGGKAAFDREAQLLNEAESERARELAASGPVF